MLSQLPTRSSGGSRLGGVCVGSQRSEAGLTNASSFSDFKLVVKGTALPAHKIVLAARSPWFRRALLAEPAKTAFELSEPSSVST